MTNGRIIIPLIMAALIGGGCQMEMPRKDLAKADFNKDGVEDSIIFYGDSYGQLRLVNGRYPESIGSLIEPESHGGIGDKSITDLTVYDLNGDGSVDISYKLYDQPKVLYNEGNGIFKNPEKTKMVWMKR